MIRLFSKLLHKSPALRSFGKNPFSAACPSSTLGRTFGTSAAVESGAKELVKIGFVGAGGVSFGTAEGPWNHSVRLEKQPNVQFTAIIDPNLDLAQKRVDDLSKGAYGHKWKGCDVYKSYQAMLEDVSKEKRPDAMIIGVPPMLHGSLDVPSCAMEVDLAKAGMHLLVEKPISMRPAEEVERLAEVLHEMADERKLVIAVGYMLRYNPAIETAKALLKELGRLPTSIVGRYNCTYNNIYKPQWWNTLESGGCIVEQATHFVDAMRYLSGSELQRDSIRAIAVGPDMELSEMPPPPNAEHTVPYDLRVNRATVAVFRFESGAVGSLNHTLLMHGQNFFTELDIYGDGFHIIVRDPYQKPAVILRRPLSNDYEQVPLDLGRDMYEKQFDAFLHAVRTGDQSNVRCLFHDAARTYETSWWISEAAGSPIPDGSVAEYLK
ncbi:hypothetical protein WJX75_007736 [Coccomyxa subellipsoidea]|uniref:NAD(P)-binding protein n=1 Tax=Coccomyxa subellipsoidea TaxID=248742 RepID=A0ABR2YN19_9CHLO